MGLALINLYTFLAGLSRSAFTVLYNLFLRSLGLDNAFVGEVNLYYSWGLALGGLIFSGVSDRIGRKRTILLTAPSYALFGLLRTFATQPLHILALSAFFGFFDTSIVLPTISVIERSVEKHRLRNSNLNFAIVMLTGVLGYFGAGSLSDLLGFKVALIVASVIAFLSAIPIMFVHEKVARRRHRSLELSLNVSQAVMLAYYLVSGALVSYAAGIFVNFGNVIFYDLFGLTTTAISSILAVSQLATAASSLFSHKLAEALGYKLALFTLYSLVTMLIYLMPLVLRSTVLFTTTYVLRFVLLNLTIPMYTVFCLDRLPRGYMASFSGVSYFLNNIMRALAARSFSLLSRGDETNYPSLFTLTGHFYLVNTLATFGTFVLLLLVAKAGSANNVLITISFKPRRKRPGERGYLLKVTRSRRDWGPSKRHRRNPPRSSFRG